MVTIGTCPKALTVVSNGSVLSLVALFLALQLPPVHAVPSADSFICVLLPLPGVTFVVLVRDAVSKSWRPADVLSEGQSGAERAVADGTSVRLAHWFFWLLLLFTGGSAV